MLTQVILQTIFIAVLARLISVEAFGVMAIALVVVGFIEIFSQIGIGPALIQKKDPTPAHLSAAFTISVILGVFFTTLLYFLSPLIAMWYHHPPLEGVLKVIGFSFLIASLAIVPKSMIIKSMDFKKLFIASGTAMTIGNIVIGLGLAYLGYDLWAYVFALLSQNVIMMIFFWIFHPIKINVSWNLNTAKEMIIYGGGSTIFNIFNYAATKIDTLIVSVMSGGSIDFTASESTRWGETGIYDRSVYLMGLPITVLGKLSDSVLFSGLSLIQDEIQQLQRAVLSAIYHIALLVIPGTALLLTNTREITILFLGEDYAAAVPIVQILFIGVIFRSLIKIGDAVVRALRTKYLYLGSLVKAAFFIFVATGAYFGYKYGLQGVAWGLLVAVFLQFLLMTVLCSRILKLASNRMMRKLIPGIIAGILTALGAIIVRLVLPEDLDMLFLRAIACALGAISILFIGTILAPWLFEQGEDQLLRNVSKRVPVSFIKNRWSREA